MSADELLTSPPTSGPGSVADGGIAIRDLQLQIGPTEILRGISLDAPAGQITGLAGESGSGKTITGLTVIGLEPPAATRQGQVWFNGVNLIDLSRKEMNRYRGVDLAMVFQDPSASLHPMLTIERQLTDHVRFHEKVSKAAAREMAIEMLARVKVPEPASALKKYPHQFSGGQLQRISLASALILRPKVLLADEPTTALDVTVQAGILALLRSLCDELQIAVVLVTHDLAVMSSIADTIAVMRQGLIVEQGHRQQVIQDPESEYARELIEALPQHRPPLGGLVNDA